MTKNVKDEQQSETLSEDVSLGQQPIITEGASDINLVDKSPLATSTKDV